jgi:hypothetical protein
MNRFWGRIFGRREGSEPGGNSAVPPPKGPGFVLLNSGIPGELDTEQVVLGTPTLGPYSLFDGTEKHAMCAWLTLMSGERLRVGVGSQFAAGSSIWIVTKVVDDASMAFERADTVNLSDLVIPQGSQVVYPQAQVSNLWIQKDQPVATWLADMSEPMRNAPESIPRWIDTILDAGEAFRVLQIHEVSEQGYRDVEDGPFGAWLNARRGAGDPPDLLPKMGGLRASAELAFFNKAGHLITSPVQRLDRVLGREEPFEGAFAGMMENHPPISLIGTEASTIKALLAGDSDRRAELRIALHSDIWFPWINGVNHPHCDYKRCFDNRILAKRHTPRLNAFLEAVADATEEAGGRFGLDRDETNSRPETLTDRGIVLDGPEPTAQFTENERNAPWDQRA